MTERVMPESTTPSGSATPFSVTVVVPTRNSARTIEPCLQSLRAQSTPCTVVVVDNGSTDGTQDLAEPLADILLAGGPERSAQRNQGARAAPASIVGFIDSDMVVTERVVEEAAAAITEGAGAVIVPERTIGVGYWARVRAFERSFYNGSDALGAARFYQWDVFEQAGRFDEHLTGPEDWDLTIEARQLAPVVHISAMIDHDEGRVRYFDACAKKGYYATGLRRFAAKRGMGALRVVANRPWLREPRQLATPLGAGLVALKVGEATAVSWALARGRFADRRLGSSASEDDA